MMWMFSAAWAAAPSYPDADVMLAALDAELARTIAGHANDPDKPYFLSYRVAEWQRQVLRARYGAIVQHTDNEGRTLDVSARVGSPLLDSSHQLKGDFVASTNFHIGQSLPMRADQASLQAVLWMATYKEISDAQERWMRVKTNQTVKVQDEDQSGDFTLVTPVVDIGGPTVPVGDMAAWRSVLTEVSRTLDANEHVHNSFAEIRSDTRTETYVSSDGTRLRHGKNWIRVALYGSTTLDDGADVGLYRWKDVPEVEGLPDPDLLSQWASSLVTDLAELRDAPPGDAYSGPVMLRGMAAGVFIHEVLGHRVEGHRQKEDDEGQTFKDKIGTQLLPRSVSIIDDPTLANYAGHALNGHYRYDQEGTPAERAVIVKDGVLEGFLMSRSPVEGFVRSNGHGRAAEWRNPVARMANTIIETTDPKSQPELRRMLVAEIKAQGRPYGLLVDEIAGGFTLTGRIFPNAFNVRAVTAWRVYADGRPDERVRGVDLVGTPLVALSNIVALGDDPAVFNGFCGAESGMVPNSAVSPSLFVRTLEVQKKEKGADRPPLLAKPKAGGDT